MRHDWTIMMNSELVQSVRPLNLLFRSSVASQARRK